MLSIDWLPSKNDSVPLYRQIFLYIRNKIITGQWPVGSKLPAQRLLAPALHVNRSTLQTALDELIADGFLKSRIGSGITISNNTWAEYTAEHPPNWNSYLSSGTYLSNLPVIQQINQREFDKDIIRLGTGELAPDLLPNQQLRHIIKSSASRIKSFGYQEPRGLPELRQEISRHLQSYGIEAAPSGILVVSGALQALQLICFGLLSSDDYMFVERPSYLLSLKLFRSLHLHFSELPVEHDGLSIDALRQQQRHHRHSLLYTIPTFHNPTGTLMPLTRRQELLQICRELRLPILEDDVYRELWIDKEPPPPLKSLDTAGNVLYVSSLSKSIGPGLRIGWIVGPEPIIEKLADLKMQHDYGCSTLSQQVAAEWLSGGYEEDHLCCLRKNLRLRRDLTNTLLHKHFADLADWDLPQGGFYIWLRFKSPLSMHRLFHAALAKHILLNPGNIYDSLASSSLRISYAYATPKELHHAIAALAEIVQTL